MSQDVFQAIADPTRREIMNVVVHHSQTIDRVAENFDMSRQAVSKHIKILEECGLIVINQQGRERWCVAKPEKLKAVTTWIEHTQKMWMGRMNRMENLLDEMQRVNKPVKTKSKKTTR